MQYTDENLERDIDRRNGFLAEIHADRGKRYGTREDVLANVAAFGWVGAVISSNECQMRLNKMVDNLMCGKEVDSDDLINASRDLTNYSHYVEILFTRGLVCSQENEA